MKPKIALPKQLKHMVKPLKPLLQHHFFFAILALLLILIGAVFVMNQTLQTPSDEAYREEKTRTGISGNFDQATIDKIEHLQRSSDQSSGQPVFPPGTRTNPFAE